LQGHPSGDRLTRHRTDRPIVWRGYRFTGVRSQLRARELAGLAYRSSVVTLNCWLGWRALWCHEWGPL